MKLWLGPKQLLVSIKDIELIKEVLLKAEDKLPLTGRAFRLAFGRSSLFVSSFNKVCHVHMLLLFLSVYSVLIFVHSLFYVYFGI